LVCLPIIAGIICFIFKIKGFAIAEHFILQLILTELAFLVLFFDQPKSVAIVFITLSVIAYPVDFFHQHLSPTEMNKRSIVMNKNEYKAITNYFKANTTKDVTKYYNFIAQDDWFGIKIPKKGYFPSFSPYFFYPEINISNNGVYGSAGFATYSVYTSNLAPKYHHNTSIGLMPFMQNAIDSLDYEFIIYDKNVTEFYNIIEPHLDNSRPKLQFDHDGVLFTISALKDRKYPDEVFSNGYIRVINKNTNTKVTKFKSDFKTSIKATINSTEESVVEYLFLPNNNLHYYIDGKKQKYSQKLTDTRIRNYDKITFHIPFKYQREYSIMHSFTVPKGKHTIEIKYINWWEKLFAISYVIYVLIFILILLQIIYKKFLKKNKT
jgi:hypothetical protein